MIEVNELDLAKFTQDVYELSTPQGLGFFQAKEGGLEKEEAERIVSNFQEDTRIALSLDYVHGRSCKMTIWRKDDDGYKLNDSWYDHSESQYDELLSRHGVAREEIPVEKCAESPSIGVPSGCKLDPALILAVAMGGNEHPCDRCNIDRKECKGYARKERSF